MLYSVPAFLAFVRFYAVPLPAYRYSMRAMEKWKLPLFVSLHCTTNSLDRQRETRAGAKAGCPARTLYDLRECLRSRVGAGHPALAPALASQYRGPNCWLIGGIPCMTGIPGMLCIGPGARWVAQ
jgi:hypothetical protein